MYRIVNKIELNVFVYLREPPSPGKRRKRASDAGELSARSARKTADYPNTDGKREHGRSRAAPPVAWYGRSSGLLRYRLGSRASP